MKDLTYYELNNIEGGAWQFALGILAGWVAGEVIDGIYQAEQRGCI